MTSTSSATQEERKEDASLYFVLFSGLLAAVIILSRILHDYPTLNSFFSEAALVLSVGMVAGFFARLYIASLQGSDFVNDDDEMVEEAYRVANKMLSFSPNIFFMALLPPILFNSGYQLRRELFYRHIKPIVMFSCIGTFISAISTAMFLYGIQEIGWMGNFDPSLLELLTFGSLIAATDTVSVLAVFQKKRVDPHVFYLVFGESALNDAVALVLFKTFAQFLQDNFDGGGSVWKSCSLFMTDIFLAGIGSPALGIFSGFVTALIFKYIDFRHHPHLELPLYLVLLLYVPFIIAECLKLSGIVSIFFCGISARRYVSPNVSMDTAKSAENVFKVAAYLAETAIFLELGLTVFGLKGSFQWPFILWSFLAALLGRAISIYPLALLFNLSLKEEVSNSSDRHLNPVEGSPSDSKELERATSDLSGQTMSLWLTDPVSLGEASLSSIEKKMKRKLKTPHKRKDKHITLNMMHVLWFAGLRGAVAYACVRDFPDLFGHNDEFIAATVVIVFGTIIGMGGATEHLLRYLQIEMDVDEDIYMADWHQKRRLKGTFHAFEHNFIYSCVVRESSSTTQENSEDSVDVRESKVLEVEKAFGYQPTSDCQPKAI